MRLLSRRSLLRGGGSSRSGAPVVDAPRSALAGPRAAYFPNVPLVTHEGKPVRFYDDLIHGKIVAITFMFAQCDGQCPTVTANLRKVQDLLGSRVGRDIFMYSITLKPKQDTPAVLAEYAAMHHIKPGWWLLTGRSPDIDLLRVKLGFTVRNEKEDSDLTQHIGMVRFGNEALDRWAACPAMANPADIARRLLRMLDAERGAAHLS